MLVFKIPQLGAGVSNPSASDERQIIGITARQGFWVQDWDEN